MCKGEIDSFQESDYICKNCSSDKYNLIKNLDFIKTKYWYMRYLILFKIILFYK